MILDNENQLVKDLIAGNENAFRKLFDMYKNDLYKYSLSMVVSKDYAEEIVQDVFMTIWLKRASLNLEMSFRAYIFTITRNKTIKFLKKAANSQKLRQEVFYKSQKFAKPTDINLRETELENLKEKALKNLSPKKREIFDMSREEEKSYEEIAAELGISVNTVKNQMSKSLGILRDYLLKNSDVVLILFISFIG
ncbi:RNA polymerase subunit sigma-24 [Wenyingzhuangia fucanilytica]|uniref:RNA polymerase sigma factor n=1 Tax=Wenyingzhuangia fucanilytica TaxID=1790137 RepID=A0A1B1Y3S4_9FLAO|nr:RNA polymerase sigma-70 factor [Wenyingzhuangia fucanilytica]ANW95389.1 RNA polymerase subunit sigma-24 [Wenyingzhuangia fucanilytica]